MNRPDLMTKNVHLVMTMIDSLHSIHSYYIIELQLELWQDQLDNFSGA